LTLLTVSLPVAWAMTSFFRRAWQEAGPRAAFWVLLGLALGSPLTVYASLYYSHALCAALLWFSFDAITREEQPPPGRSALAGLLAGWANLSEMPTGLITLCLLAYLFFAYRFAWKQTLAFILGGLPTLGILLTYNWAAFGDPLANGYQYCYIEAFRESMSHGIMGVGWPTWEAFVGISVGPYRGLLLHWPFFFFCVLPAIAILAYRMQYRGPVLLALLIVLVYLLFGCSYFLWSGGSAYGPRHLVPCFPFAAYLVVRAARAFPRFWIPTFAILSVVIVLMAISTLAEFIEAARVPLLQIVLLAFLQGELSVKAIGLEGRFEILKSLDSNDPRFFDAVNLGELIGLRGIASLAPLFVVSVIMAVVLWQQINTAAQKSSAERGQLARVDLPDAAFEIACKLTCLAIRFILQRSFDAANGVEVLHLNNRRRKIAPVRLRHMKVDIRIAAQAAFLHLAIGDADLAQ
jgi:hypothetical protein